MKPQLIKGKRHSFLLNDLPFEIDYATKKEMFCQPPFVPKAGVIPFRFLFVEEAIDVSYKPSAEDAPKMQIEIKFK